MKKISFNDIGVYYLRNFLNLYRGHLKSSKRILIISSIGLILALTIVSSTNYYFDNSKVALIDNYFNSGYGTSRSSDISISFNRPFPYNESIVSKTRQLIAQTAKDYHINSIQEITSIAYLNNLELVINASDSQGNSLISGKQSIPIIQLNSSVLQELNAINTISPIINNSEVPTEAFTNNIPNIYFLSFDPTYAQIKLNLSSTRNTYLYDCNYCSYTPHNYSIKMAGAASINFNQYIYNGSGKLQNPYYNKYPKLKSLLSKISGNSGFVLLTPDLKSFSNILDQSFYNSLFSSPIIPRFYYSFSIYFDYGKIDPYNANSFVQTINNYLQVLYVNIYTQIPGVTLLVLQFNSRFAFLDVQNVVSDILVLLLLISLPVLITTIFVINYSFGLINKNIIRQIGIYKTRGAKSRLIFIFQLVDMALIIVFSIMVALFTGIPLTALVLRTDFLLSFNYPPPTYLVLNFIPVSNLLLYFGVVLLLLVNIFRLRRLSLLSISETEDPVERGEPFWKTHYIDLFLLAFGLLMYFTLLGMDQNPNLQILLEPVINIISLLMLPAPFALVIGLILVVNRIIPVILNKIGNKLWLKTGGLVAFSFKNVIRHREASTRAVMLIAILLTFLVLFYSLPTSLIANSEKNLYYTNGADVTGSFTYGYNQTDLNIIQENFSQYLNAYSPYVILSTYSSSVLKEYNVLLVNTSSYLNAAYTNFNLGLSKGLSNDINNLNASNSTLNILADRSILQDHHAAIGGNIQLIHQNKQITMHLIDTFTHWPMLMSKINYQNPYYAIGNISYYLNTINLNVSNSPFKTVIANGVFFNFKAGVNQTLISTWIQGNTSINIQTNKIVSVQLHKQYSTVQFLLELGQINNDVLMVLIIAMAVLIMFAYLQLNERKREIYTERALGMKLLQIASLFFIEGIILSITSVVIGIVVGWFLMELLAFVIFNPLNSFPAFEILIPMNYVLITSALILLVSILVSVIPAYYVTKQDISNSFGEV